MIDKFYFRHNFKGYKIGKPKRGILTMLIKKEWTGMWCVCLKDIYPHKIGDRIYLGHIEQNRIVKVKKFYELPWDIQKGGERLFLKLENLIADGFGIWYNKTMQGHPPKTERNKLIVKLKDKGWSYDEIRKELGLRAKSTVHEIYHREKSRSELSTVRP